MPQADNKNPKNTLPRLLTDDDVKTLEAFNEGYQGYFWKMLDYLNKFVAKGVEEGRFTEKQAQEDVELALWFGYAYNNLDIYPAYYRTLVQMKPSEKNAHGCGAWYYRYSVALMYCGKLNAARQYAEQAVTEDPSYPWGWLQAAKLRYHFGDKDGAQAAIAKGLELEPDNYEFLTLHKEINLGYTLEQLEYHWIGPEEDKRLHEGLDQDADDKQRAIAGIVTDHENLARIKELFKFQGWDADDPFCHGIVTFNQFQLQMLFRMNEAALSKLDYNWLKKQRDTIAMHYVQRPCGNGICQLVFIGINLDYSIDLVYYDLETEKHYEISTPKNGDLSSEAILSMDFADETIDRNLLN